MRIRLFLGLLLVCFLFDVHVSFLLGMQNRTGISGQLFQAGENASQMNNEVFDRKRIIVSCFEEVERYQHFCGLKNEIRRKRLVDEKFSLRNLINNFSCMNFKEEINRGKSNLHARKTNSFLRRCEKVEKIYFVVFPIYRDCFANSLYLFYCSTEKKLVSLQEEIMIKVKFSPLKKKDERYRTVEVIVWCGDQCEKKQTFIHSHKCFTTKEKCLKVFIKDIAAVLGIQWEKEDFYNLYRLSCKILDACSPELMRYSSKQREEVFNNKLFLHGFGLVEDGSKYNLYFDKVIKDLIPSSKLYFSMPRLVFIGTSSLFSIYGFYFLGNEGEKSASYLLGCSLLFWLASGLYAYYQNMSKRSLFQ